MHWQTPKLSQQAHHLYREDEVKEDLNRKAEAHEPLPDLVQKAPPHWPMTGTRLQRQQAGGM